MKGDNSPSIDILGLLVRLVGYHIQLKNHYGRSFYFCQNEFCKKRDDCVAYIFLKLTIFTKIKSKP
jgi:hypothetical protein